MHQEEKNTHQKRIVLGFKAPTVLDVLPVRGYMICKRRRDAHHFDLRSQYKIGYLYQHGHLEYNQQELVEVK